MLNLKLHDSRQPGVPQTNRMDILTCYTRDIWPGHSYIYCRCPRYTFRSTRARRIHRAKLNLERLALERAARQIDEIVDYLAGMPPLEDVPVAEDDLAGMPPLEDIA